MRMRREPPVQIKTPGQLDLMREAGLVVARALGAAVRAVEPGITTAELDAIAEYEIRAAGAVPSFKGYHGFPGSICASVNDEIVHGIPSPDRRLAAGDLISIDCGAIVEGWHGDAAVTVGVGVVDDEAGLLIDACETALWHGLAQARPGHRLTDISHAVEASARSSGRYGIVEEYVGHGIGTEMHMDPPVPSYGKPGLAPSWPKAWCSRSSRCSPSAMPAPACATMAGPSSPPTGPGRRTSSTRWPSPRTGHGCSRRPMAAGTGSPWWPAASRRPLAGRRHGRPAQARRAGRPARCRCPQARGRVRDDADDG